ncbi:unnamed protein product, partial [Prorocentrum cordatum]
MSNPVSSELALDCGATTTAGGGDGVTSSVETAMNEHPKAECHIDGDDKPWFKFANGEWGHALSEAWLHSPAGWLGACVLGADDVPVLTGVDWLNDREVSLRSNSLQLYDK